MLAARARPEFTALCSVKVDPVVGFDPEEGVGFDPEDGVGFDPEDGVGFDPEDGVGDEPEDGVGVGGVGDGSKRFRAL